MNRVTSVFKYSAFKHHCALCAAACGFAYASIANANDCSPWDATIGQPGMNGAVWSLAALPNGDLIAGGNFTTAGGVEASRIARWDGSNWHNLGDGVNGGVLALVVLPDGDVIAAGLFTMAGDTPVSNIARWDGTNWHALGSGVDGAVRALAVMASGDVIAGGHFTTAGGTVANYIARWHGGAWHSLAGGMDGFVHALEVFDDGDGPALYAGGSFTTAGSVEVNHIARWDGAVWSPLVTGIDQPVQALHGHQSDKSRTLYAAGSAMTAAGAVPLFTGMARWDGSAHKWSPEGDGIRGTTRAMMSFDDGSGPAMFAAIHDPELNQSYLARWDGWWWMPVSSPVKGLIVALAHTFQDDQPMLYAAGTFSHAGEKQAAGLVRWHYCPPAPPTVRHVPGNYATIQAAIGAANDGDVVRVAPGTYNEAIDFFGRTIVIESEAGAEVTTLDATGLDTTVVTVAGGEGLGTTLRGFTVTGGTGTLVVWDWVGGGVLVRESTLTIEQCVIIGNEALGGNWWSRGGGIAALAGAELLVVETSLVKNASERGGGAFVDDNQHARFIDCAFHHNTAEAESAGVHVGVEGYTRFADCLFEENAVSGLHWSGNNFGGGLMALRSVVVEHCEFRRNNAPGRGGAIAMAGGVISNCLFAENTAARGGALTMFGSSETSVFDSRIENNSAIFNGGGIDILSSGELRLLSTTHFCGNSPEHIYGSLQDLGGNTFADYCDGIPGDLNGDGVVDVSDLLILLAAWGACPTGGTPVPLDAPPCPADFNGDGAVDVSDLLILLSNWG